MTAGGIRAVCFDLDGTLLRDDHIDNAMRQVAAELGRRHPRLDPAQLLADSARIGLEYWAEAGDGWMLGAIPTDALPIEVWRRVLAVHGVDSEAAAQDAYALQLLLEGASLRLYDEALEVLDSVRARGIRTAVVTNGPSALQRAKLAAVGLSDGFDAVIVSAEVGVQKPEAAIFASALDALGVPAEAALHIGDSQAADVAGARAAGLTAVWIDRNGAASASAPHAVVTDLRGLLDLL